MVFVDEVYSLADMCMKWQLAASVWISKAIWRASFCDVILADMLLSNNNSLVATQAAEEWCFRIPIHSWCWTSLELDSACSTRRNLNLVAVEELRMETVACLQTDILWAFPDDNPSAKWACHLVVAETSLLMGTAPVVEKVDFSSIQRKMFRFRANMIYFRTVCTLQL